MSPHGKVTGELLMDANERTVVVNSLPTKPSTFRNSHQKRKQSELQLLAQVSDEWGGVGHWARLEMNGGGSLATVRNRDKVVQCIACGPVGTGLTGSSFATRADHCQHSTCMSGTSLTEDLHSPSPQLGWSQVVPPLMHMDRQGDYAKNSSCLRVCEARVNYSHGKALTSSPPEQVLCPVTIPQPGHGPTVKALSPNSS